jgi:hypothetical protein
MDSLEELTQQLHDEATMMTVAASEAVSVVGSSTACSPVYSHESMLELLINHPGLTHTQIANHFGHDEGWFSMVLASDAFQMALAPYKHLVNDPSITATMEERFRALALQSVTVLQSRLGKEGVSDLVVLKATEIGVKALGMGQVSSSGEQIPTGAGGIEAIADRILATMEKAKLRHAAASAVEFEVVEEPTDGS